LRLIDFLPKEVLEQVKRKSFKFLWVSESRRKKVPCASRKKIAALKEMGGLRIKNIHCFAKCMWRLIEGSNYGVM
jgi:hypothetical protein